MATYRALLLAAVATVGLASCQDGAARRFFQAGTIPGGIAAVLTPDTRATVTPVDARTVIISISGAGESDNAKMIKAMLHAASDATLERGFSHFSFSSVQDATISVAQHRGGTAQCSGTMDMVQVGPTPSFQANCDTTPPSTKIVKKPGLDSIIKMFKPDEIDPKKEGVFDANWIAAQD